MFLRVSGEAFFECLAVQDGTRFSRPKLSIFVTWAATASPSPTPRRSLMLAEEADQGLYEV